MTLSTGAGNIMAHLKTVAGWNALATEMKIRHGKQRWSEEPLTILSNESEAGTPPRKSMTKATKGKLLESLASSPYAVQKSQLFPRSMSVPKVPGKCPVAASLDPVEKTSSVLGFARSDTVNRKLRLWKQPKAHISHDSQPLQAHGMDLSNESSRISFNSSFNASVQLLPSESPLPGKGKKGGKTLKQLEVKLAKALKAVEGGSEIQVVSQTFREFIEITSVGKPLLSRIKSAYDTCVQRLSAESKQQQRELSTLQTSLRKESEEKSAFIRKLDKIAQENSELSEACESLRGKCFDYQKKLFEIANARVSTFPPTEEAWSGAIAQLADLRTLQSDTEKQLRTAMAKQRKLLQLINALKARGYPVEEVYNLDVAAGRSVRSSDRVESVMPTEKIMIGRTEGIPQLKLRTAVQRQDSSHASPDSLEISARKGQVSNASSEKTDKCSEMKPGGFMIPKIPIPEIDGREDHGFQQEFMTHYDEFSESWRQMIDAQKH